MENLLNMVLDFKAVIKSLVLLVVVIVGMGLANRLLVRNAAKMSGRRFRNQVIMTGLGFCGLLIVIMGLPIGTEMRGQLLSLIGIIISAAIALSSSTILSNAMAGIMLKTVRNFHSGDFVTAGEFFGRVTERGLFHTEIQTADRDLVTMPNLYLVTVPVKVVRSSGTIVSATVSLGYDVPQSRIKELLLQAAEEIQLKEPFVQVLDLGDYSVTYRVAGLLEESVKLIAYRSRLRSAVLDTLHKGSVEIVSPSFMNVRDFNPDREFIPALTRARPDATADAAPAEVVFDKAEVAASLSALTQERKDLEEELKAARQTLKDAKEEADKKAAESQVTLLEARLEVLVASEAEAQIKEQEHDS